MSDDAMMPRVSGSRVTSARALVAGRAICDAALLEGYWLDVGDLLMDPLAADDARLVAGPTPMRRAPPSPRRGIGDSCDTARGPRRASVVAVASRGVTRL
jgi:hypothetical protein